MSRVIVGMSGGVDSAAAAFLLREAGHEVIGLTIRTWSGGASRCCEIDDARATARKLGIDYHVLNCVSDFEKNVEKPFIDDYLNGMTPNPCVICNERVKWSRLIYMAEILKADWVATGHYADIARLDNGRYAIKKAADTRKDQSYMLYRLTQEQLSRTILPLCNKTKNEIREIAERAGIPGANKPDSQELCFVTEGDYADYIKSHTDREIPGEGNFTDENGVILGRHKGIIYYTVGQRKGLGIALGHPAYIKNIRADKNEIVIGDEKSLYSQEILCGDLRFMSVSGIQENESDNINKIRVKFEKPVRAATPGQSAVFYDDMGYIIGGGVILKAY